MLISRLGLVLSLFALAASWPVRAVEQVAEIKAGVVKIITAPGSKTGAGIVVRRDRDEAWIVTAMHVVSDAQSISVQVPGVGKSWTAEVKEFEFDNPSQGLALLGVTG